MRDADGNWVAHHDAIEQRLKALLEISLTLQVRIESMRETLRREMDSPEDGPDATR